MRLPLLFAAAFLLVLAGLAVWLLQGHDAGTEGELAALDREAESGALDPLRASGASERGAEARDVRRDAGRDGTEALPQAAANDAASLDLAVLWESDRAPAADIEVELEQVDPTSSRPRPLVAKSDAAGNIRWDRLTAGTYFARSSIGGWLDLELPAGVATRATLELPAGFWIDGTAVDGAGLPVAGAEIWLGSEGHAMLGSVVTHTLSNGAFSLRTATPSVCLGARKAEYRPSLLHDVESKPDARVSVQLVLEAGGAVLEGRVTAGGAPRADAWIVVGSGKHTTEGEGPDGRYRFLPSAIDTRSDGEGRFRLTGLPIGKQEIIVRAERCAAWLGSIELAAGEPRQLEVALEVEAVLEGRASDRSGAPISGARIRTGDEKYTILHRSRIWTSKSDANGRFRIGELPAGPRDASVEASGCAPVTAKLVLASGATTSWNPIVGSGSRLFGRLLDDADAPLAGWRVFLQRSATGGEGVALPSTTDEGGHFLFEGLEPLPHRLQFADPSARPHLASLVLTDAVPSETELVLRVASSARASAHVIGRLLDHKGSPPEAAEVWIRMESSPGGYRRNAERSGDFEIGPLPPGTYHFHAEAPGLPPLELGRFVLAPHERVDLGEHRFAAAARLEVEIEAAPGIDAKSAVFEIWQQERWIADVACDGELAAREGLAAGNYELRLSTAGLLCTPIPLELRAGETKRVHARLERGAKVAVKFECRDSLRFDPPAAFRILAADERAVVTWKLDEMRAGGFTFTTTLAPGRYRAEVQGASAAPWSGEFAVLATLEDVACSVPLATSGAVSPGR